MINIYQKFFYKSKGYAHSVDVPPQKAKTLKKAILTFFFAVTLTLSFASCSLITENLEEETKNFVNENFANEGVDIIATDITLVHENGNKYSGQVTLLVDGEEDNYDINVIYDGRSIIWKINFLNL